MTDINIILANLKSMATFSLVLSVVNFVSILIVVFLIVYVVVKNKNY